MNLSATSVAHTRYDLGGLSVNEKNGEYYVDDYYDLMKVSASAEFMKNIGRVTATYTAPRRSMMRETGVYVITGAEATLQPCGGGSVKDPYNTYEVYLVGTSLDSLKKLLVAIMDGSIRPSRSLHGVQQGISLQNQEEIIRSQESVIYHLTNQLERAHMVLGSFSAVYADYQRVVKEQRAVIAGLSN